MAQEVTKSKRKPSGARVGLYRKPRQYALAGKPILTGLNETQRISVRTVGNNKKERLTSTNIVNVVDPKTNKASVQKIQTVVDNPANRNFVRRNIITKGTIVQTPAGKVKITSRPGQSGALNGVLVV